MFSLLSSVFPPQKNSHVNHLVSPDSPPLSPNNPSSTLPPPLPIKTRELIPRGESPPPPAPPAPPHPPQVEDTPSESPPPPPLTRSGTARVSFREPISSSYSVDEDEEDEEDEEGDEEEEKQQHQQQEEGEDAQQAEDEMEEGFGSRLHLQKGIPPQMDLLGESDSLFIRADSLSSHSLSPPLSPPDGSSYHQRSLRRGWGRCRIPSDPSLHPGAERRSRRSRPPDRPRLETLDWRGEKDRDGRTAAAASTSTSSSSSLTLQPGHYKHEDCSTCSSSSDSEEEGYFLGQPIPLPPQLRKQQPPEEGREQEGEGEEERGREVQRDWGLRGSLRRGRAHSLGAKDKDKNCAIS